MRKRRSQAWRRRIGLLLGAVALIGCVYGALKYGGEWISRNAADSHLVMEDVDDWQMILVNAWNPIPEGYVEYISLETVENGCQVDARIYDALTEMLGAMRAEGLNPVIDSAFRSNELQQELYENKVNEYRSDGYSSEEAEAQAGSWVAVPGTSEHELGLAVDISMYTDDADDIHNWLKENCSRYGFICRYPEDKVEITGISSEPWHYRYVGVEAAQEITERGLCLEEYLEEYYGGENTNQAASEQGAEQAGHFVQEKDADWTLILVNRWNPLPETYEIELTELANGESVDSRIYPALQEMFDTARAEGVYPIVVSGYRTVEEQTRIMDEKIQEYLDEGYAQDEAEDMAQQWVAVPGTSEHQLGIAVDINADGINSAGYEVYDWLAEHCWEYGFIRRYPEDKTEITGVSNEPWHYRYVGVEAAREITEAGLCLEEYLLQSKN